MVDGSPRRHVRLSRAVPPGADRRRDCRVRGRCAVRRAPIVGCRLADVAEQLPSVAVPVLLAWGAADPVFDDSFALDLAQRMPHADLQRFLGIGHLRRRKPMWPARWSLVQASRDRVLVAGGGTGPQKRSSALRAALQRRASDDDGCLCRWRHGTPTSFVELHDRVMGIAAGLSEQGLQPGDRVAMLCHREST